MDPDSEPFKSNSVIDILRDIVLKNMDNPDFDVETFANLSGVSRSDLYRKIKRYTGKSVTEFIRDLRLEEAMKLLDHTDLTASEISFKVGFNSPTYFSKCFKDKYGITPGEADAGVSPRMGSLYDDNIRKLKPKPVKFWRPRYIWILFMVVLVSGFGYWYYIARNDHTSKEKSTPSPVVNDSLADTNNISIAVLPMNDWSSERNIEHICFGITDNIIDELNRTKYFRRVVPINDVMALPDSTTNHRELARVLNVNHILSGNLQKAGNKLKVSLQFTETEHNRILWSDHFVMEWNQSEVFTMQKMIADEVLRALGETIAVHEEKSDEREPGTFSTKAYDLYVKGRYQLTKYTKEGFENSVRLFSQAIEEDPDYVDAYSSLGFTWWFSGAIWGYTSQEEAWRNAKKYLYKVLELDKDNQSAIRVLKMGYIFYELNFNPVVRDFPQIASYKLENTLFDYALKIGLYGKSEQQLKGTLSNCPNCANTHALLALTHFLSGNKKEAKSLLDESYPLFDDDHEYLRESAKTYFFLGEIEKMKRATNTFYEKFDDRPPIMIWLKAISHDYNGEIKERDALVDTLENLYKNNASGSPGWFLALYHTHKKNYDLALEWLEKSYTLREVEMTWLAQEPVLEPLGAQPRYVALLDSMNFPKSARRHVDFID